MKHIRDHNEFTADSRNAVLALGNFDGVHLGHQAVIENARRIAQENNVPAGVLTFEPHPRQFFADRANTVLPPFRLMNASARAHQLEKMGLDVLIEHPFSKDLANLSAEDFATTILKHYYGASHVVVGLDFFFGNGRTGDIDTLKALGDAHGFGVTTTQLVEFEGLEISSTAIRKALSDGNPRLARQMLGHWHRVDGIVEHGEKRGRKLGFPTANLSITDLHPPKFGVYASLVTVYDGPTPRTYNAATSIGVRPMFEGQIANCESFLFDFDDDLYDQNISVALVDYLRPELKFDGLQALIDQMNKDCDTARKILANV